jgi:hypothetical protein
VTKLVTCQQQPIQPPRSLVATLPLNLLCSLNPTLSCSRLLQNFWDASCHDGDVGEQRHDDDAFNSSSVTHEQETTTCPAAAAAATATNSFFHCELPRARLNKTNKQTPPLRSPCPD